MLYTYVTQEKEKPMLFVEGYYEKDRFIKDFKKFSPHFKSYRKAQNRKSLIDFFITVMMSILLLSLTNIYEDYSLLIFIVGFIIISISMFLIINIKNEDLKSFELFQVSALDGTFKDLDEEDCFGPFLKDYLRDNKQEIKERLSESKLISGRLALEIYNKINSDTYKNGKRIIENEKRIIREIEDI